MAAFLCHAGSFTEPCQGVCLIASIDAADRCTHATLMMIFRLTTIADDKEQFT